MFRIHFTAEDLARTRIASGPDAFWELLLSVHALQARHGGLRLGPWRQRVERRLPTVYAKRLVELAPPKGYSPDFLTPPAGQGTFDESLELVLSTGRRTIEAEVAELAGHRPVTPWLREVARADAAVLRQLGDALSCYYSTALRPYWPSICAAVAIDRSARLEQLAAGGVELLLTTMHPEVRWARPVLHIPALADGDLHLEGRGLLIQPAVFSNGSPTKLRGTDLSPILVLPVAVPPVVLTAGDGVGAGQALAALFGRTRARALAVTANGCTTSELARHCEITAGAASQQATALRGGGLITTRREGGSVIHEITALGMRLLSSAGG